MNWSFRMREKPDGKFVRLFTLATARNRVNELQVTIRELIR
jgi:hypothetical protein